MQKISRRYPLLNAYFGGVLGGGGGHVVSSAHTVAAGEPHGTALHYITRHAADPAPYSYPPHVYSYSISAVRRLDNSLSVFLRGLEVVPVKEAEIRLGSSPSLYSARCGGCACVANGNQRERARRPDERSARGDARETPLSLSKPKRTRFK